MAHYIIVEQMLTMSQYRDSLTPPEFVETDNIRDYLFEKNAETRSYVIGKLEENIRTMTNSYMMISAGLHLIEPKTKRYIEHYNVIKELESDLHYAQAELDSYRDGITDSVMNEFGNVRMPARKYVARRINFIKY